MTHFLIVPINLTGEPVFKLGTLFYLAAKKRGNKVRYQRVIEQAKASEREAELKTELGIEEESAMSLSAINEVLSLEGVDSLNERIAARFYTDDVAPKTLVVVEGIAPDSDRAYLFAHNRTLAALLKAHVILLLDAKQKTASEMAALIKVVQANSFEQDTLKFGYMLLNAGADTEGYVSQVQQLLASSKLDLNCLLAVSDDMSALSVNELASLAEKVEIRTLDKALKLPIDKRMAPSVYRCMVIEKAKKAHKKIVLPEGNEVRTVQAAIICHEKKIAQCILLATEEEVQKVVADLGLYLPEDIEIIDPTTIADKYVAPLVEIRKHKGLTEAKAKEALQDNVFLGTMMLHFDEVDGLVSGAVHTTANTIRPALQIIKMDAASTIVSSVFFMLMPNQVYVFGDCAVNPELDAAQMAEVAIQSADSAKAFGVDPKVAMLSYSSKDSGTGPSVDKVKEATELVKQRRPDIVVDGPLQYDAASVLSVGQKKAPGSKVAGHANVFIFPDLNAGNITYKAVQRAGNIVSIGPVLQGLNKAVNDLSRGSSVEDIVFTIAVTAIQAQQKADFR